MNWQTLFLTALDAMGIRHQGEYQPRAYEGIRERKGEDAKRYMEQANRALAKVQKRRDERAHECA